MCNSDFFVDGRYGYLWSAPPYLRIYILVWISVGICYKTSLREKTNEEIAEAFNNMNNMETS